MAGSRVPDRDEVDPHRKLALIERNREEVKMNSTRGDLWHATLARNESPSTHTHPTPARQPQQKYSTNRVQVKST
jgi:hypothetical protein